MVQPLGYIGVWWMCPCMRSGLHDNDLHNSCKSRNFQKYIQAGISDIDWVFYNNLPAKKNKYQLALGMENIIAY